MREIKFRAWLQTIKKMSHAISLQDWIHNEGLLESSGNEVYLQFTGLQDKNGKDIYEGDILDFKYPIASDDEDDFIRLRVVIDFHGGAFWFTGDGYTDCNWHFYNAVDREVIGNIYEN